MVLFSYLGWAIGIRLLNNKQLHCGGTEKSDQKTDRRLFILCWINIAGSFLTIIFIMTGKLWLTVMCFPLMFIMAVSILAEVGWGLTLWDFVLMHKKRNS